MISELNRKLLLPVALVCAASLALPAGAAASRTQETIFQDDPRITYEPDPVRLDKTMRLVRALGVDRVRVTVLWDTIAPRPNSERRPRFGKGGAGSPDGYPARNWQRLDNVVRTAKRYGLGLLFNVTGGAPAWATPGRHGHRDGVYRPSAKEFGLFVKAVGLRYSGFWPDTAMAAQPRQAESTGAFVVPGLGVTLGEEPETAQAPSGPTPRIPRVDYWSIWNEPNFPSWLLPGWEKAGRRSWRPVAPHQYRRLVNSAWAQLHASSHGYDVVLLGETAPFGPKRPKRPGRNGLVSPIVFVKEMYCLDKRYRRLRGRAARARGCPATRRARRRFRRNNRGLFAATGWAHHPYSLQNKPSWRGRRRDGATLGAISRLARALDRAQFAWGAQGQWPVWITEYGYQTMPPDPTRGVSWRRQAAWMSWAEFLAFRNRRVGSFSQFLLDDDKPSPRYSRNNPKRWFTWQSGLRTNSGRPKPYFTEFVVPIYVKPARRARRGRRMRVFSNFRPAPPGTPLTAYIQFVPRGGEERTVRKVDVKNEQGYLNAFIRAPGRGRIRVIWQIPQLGFRGTRYVRVGR